MKNAFTLTAAVITRFPVVLLIIVLYKSADSVNFVASFLDQQVLPRCPRWVYPPNAANMR